MRSTKPSVTLKSFKDLHSVRDRITPARTIAPTEQKPPVSRTEPDRQIEEDLFLQAMTDVQPLGPDVRETCLETSGRCSSPGKTSRDEVEEGMEELVRLLESGDGFVVANTPEYIEGTGHNISRYVARRLHEGQYAIEAFIDLHGYTVDAAWEACDAFIRESIKAGRQAVLIVHGRGLSSPGIPVLKTRIEEWLTRGPWRKLVVAYSSAQSCDGGLGATYVLLRRPKSIRRPRQNKSHV